jgi:hypothetical protein
MIMANVVAGVFVIGGMYIPQIKETVSTAALVLMVFQGIVQMQFGFKLLKLQDGLGGPLITANKRYAINEQRGCHQKPVLNI